MTQDAPSLDNLMAIAEQFGGGSRVRQVQPFGSGNINDTFLVTVSGAPVANHADVVDHRFVLQRINTQVFKQPQLVMQNMRIFSEHVHECLTADAFCFNRRWEVPRVLLTLDGGDHYVENDNFWRSISFIEGTQTFDTIQDLHHAQETGFGLGMFHRSIAALPPEQLADTLPGFHIIPSYLQQFDEVVANNVIPKSAEVIHCLRFIEERRAGAVVLEDAKGRGELPLRTIHGDPKINNVLIDNTTNQAISLIDLDTIKPGLIHYDIGDCLRSGCNPLGEETADWQAVHFEPELGQAMLQGYLDAAQDFLTDNDYKYIYDGLRLLAFELGLRFFTDYLNGSVYFKTKYPEHNLLRALVQFRLAESIESQESTIGKIIGDMR
jgi:Ser/Thr protein kinase RdoA (MazF antagonist)